MKNSLGSLLLAASLVTAEQEAVPTKMERRPSAISREDFTTIARDTVLAVAKVVRGNGGIVPDALRTLCVTPEDGPRKIAIRTPASEGACGREAIVRRIENRHTGGIVIDIGPTTQGNRGDKISHLLDIFAAVNKDTGAKAQEPKSKADQRVKSALTTDTKQ